MNLRGLRWPGLLVAMMLMAALAMVACGDDDDDVPEPDASTATGSTPDDEATATEDGDETPASDDGNDSDDSVEDGGEATIQYLAYASFDPHFTAHSQDIGHTGFVFRGLYQLDQDNTPQPLMAEDEPEISEDGLTVTVSLKEGLTWSDGDDLLAEDFVAGIVRTCNGAFGGQYQYLLSNIAGCDEYYDPASGATPEQVGVKAIDETTLEFTLENPQPTFPIILSLWMTYPVPVHIIDADEEWPTDPMDLVFNGPFTIESVSPGEGISFVRNESYAGERAKLYRINFQYVEDNLVSNNAFRAGQLDMVRANAAELESLRDEFPDELVSTAAPSTIALQVQMENEVLANEQVRLALSRAINREALVDVVFQGAHEPTTSWIPADSLGDPDANPMMFNDQIGFNPDAARTALADAGYPDGEGFPELSILVRDDEVNRNTAEFLQGQFNEILGIQTRIEYLDAPTRAQRFNDEQFELYPGGWNQDYPDPENWVLGQFDTGAPVNHYNCSDPDIDALITEARYNPDNTERLEQYDEINELISTRMCGAIPLYHQAFNYLVADRLAGPKELSSGQDKVMGGDWKPEAWSIDD